MPRVPSFFLHSLPFNPLSVCSTTTRQKNPLLSFPTATSLCRRALALSSLHFATHAQPLMKIVVAGSGGAGKSCCTLRYLKQIFVEVKELLKPSRVPLSYKQLCAYAANPRRPEAQRTTHPPAPAVAAAVLKSLRCSAQCSGLAAALPSGRVRAVCAAYLP